MPNLKELNEKGFKEFIGQNVALVGFWAPWCHACHRVLPMLEELSKEYHKVGYAKINVVDNPGLASRYGVMSLPNILVFKKGKVAEQIIGSISKKTIEQSIKKSLK